MPEVFTLRPVITPLRDWMRAHGGFAVLVGVESAVGVPNVRRIWADALPAKVWVNNTLAAAHIVIQRVGGGTDSPLDRPLVQLEVWGRTGTEAETVMAGALTIMESTISGTVLASGLRFRGWTTVSIVPFPDPPTDQPRYIATGEIAVAAT